LPKFARRPSKVAGLINAGEQFQRIGIQPSQGLEVHWGCTGADNSSGIGSFM
jgi:hypothetical protein